ncbi:MAG: hypothetical protein KatS3mg105_5039 [Gemmatales bacterium]|nr:MAG: hypothetical protein KatS3mg105_5039 [Gemmatales bacterium]
MITRTRNNVILYVNELGELHRERGPAVMFPSGTRFYFRRNKLHRRDGPAVIRSDGTEEYWLHGVLHRVGGPAIVRMNGNHSYYMFGVCLDHADHPKKTRSKDLDR